MTDNGNGEPRDLEKCVECHFILLCTQLDIFSDEELEKLIVLVAVKMAEEALAYEDASHGT